MLKVSITAHSKVTTTLRDLKWTRLRVAAPEGAATNDHYISLFNALHFLWVVFLLIHFASNCAYVVGGSS